MAFSGILARQLADWMAALEPALDDWCIMPPRLRF
jgi:hypothetical protein